MPTAHAVVAAHSPVQSHQEQCHDVVHASYVANRWVVHRERSEHAAQRCLAVLLPQPWVVGERVQDVLQPATAAKMSCKPW